MVNAKSKSNEWSLWNVAISISEFLVDLIKSISILGGVLAATLADVAMGTITITILVGSASVLSGLGWINPLSIGGSFSMGTSAIQIFLFSMLLRTNFSFRSLFDKKSRKKIDVSQITFLVLGVLTWIVDTTMDVSPIFLLVRDSQFKEIPALYKVVVSGMLFLAVVLCGFSEIMTTNIRKMFWRSTDASHELDRDSGNGRNRNKDMQNKDNRNMQNRRVQNQNLKNSPTNLQDFVTQRRSNGYSQQKQGDQRHPLVRDSEEILRQHGNNIPEYGREPNYEQGRR